MALSSFPSLQTLQTLRWSTRILWHVPQQLKFCSLLINRQKDRISYGAISQDFYNSSNWCSPGMHAYAEVLVLQFSLQTCLPVNAGNGVSNISKLIVWRLQAIVQSLPKSAVTVFPEDWIMKGFSPRVPIKSRKPYPLSIIEIQDAEVILSPIYSISDLGL